MKTLLASIAVLLAPFSSAQDSSKENPKAMVRFAYLAKNPETPDKLLVVARRGIEEIEISTRTPRDYVEIDASKGIVIGTKGTTDKQPVIPIAQGTPPAGAVKLTALLAPKEDGSSYGILFLDEAQFRPGAIFFLNNTSTPIGVTMEKKRLLVKERSRLLHQMPVGESSRNIYCSFHLLEANAAGESKMKLLNESTWNVSPERAEICVFYYDAGLNRIKSRGMSVFFPSFASNDTLRSPRE